MIKVVAGMIVQGGRMFLQQRAPTGALPYAWESPGGKMEETDESLPHALERELGEELGWTRESGGLFTKPRFSKIMRASKNGLPTDCEIVFFVVQPLPTWTPHLKAAVGCGWFTIEEMKGLVLTPGNAAMREFEENQAKPFSKRATQKDWW